MSEEDAGRFEDKWKEKMDNRMCEDSRLGDHMLAHFEHELCMFENLKGRHPLTQAKEDRLLLTCIRRINLIFWSRELSTASNTLSNARKLLKMLGEVNLRGPSFHGFLYRIGIIAGMRWPSVQFFHK